MNFHERTPAIGSETIPLMKPSLSGQAQEVLDVLEKVRVHPETEQHLESFGRGMKWLPMDNIVNGHNKATEEYTKLMEELSTSLNELLINSKGQHSNVFYELKNAGHNLQTGEADSSGPLSGIVVCPNANWRVCYG